MDALNQFKKVLEATCRIARWTPSALQLEQIARRVADAKPKTLSDLTGIVTNVCPGTLFMVMEGVDNSDLRTLLALATAAAVKR